MFPYLTELVGIARPSVGSSSVGARIAVIFYSSTGNVHRLATALAEGASAAGAEVRVRPVAELAPPEAIAQNERWAAHREATKGDPIASLDDLEWADGFAFGSPTRFGLPSAQLKQFLDQTGGLWAKGALADKVGTAFTSASTGHGGLEATVLSINTVLYHWGSLVLPVGYTGAAASALGNPYGASWVSRKGAGPDDTALGAARHQGERLARFAAAVATVR
jgi:NAD(P)H dehydrogenase (quinone)